jgi:putative ATP-binding cassette transporter
LFWAALIYAVFGTLITNWIGRPLVPLNFQQQRYEADFRFNLVRVRENSEQIALLHGDEAERERLLGRFGNVVGNWYALMTRQKKLTFFTAGYSQAAVVFPFVMVSPAYFANLMQLGGLMQTANAFGQVQSSLSVFVTLYRSLAEWRAVIQRLHGFEQSVASARALSRTPPVIEVVRGESEAVSFKDVAVRLPNGVPLVNATDITIRTGEKVLVSGPSGTADDPAAAAVFPDRAARSRRRVSVRKRRIRCRQSRRTDRLGWAAQARRAHR